MWKAVTRGTAGSLSGAFRHREPIAKKNAVGLADRAQPLREFQREAIALIRQTQERSGWPRELRCVTGNEIHSLRPRGTRTGSAPSTAGFPRFLTAADRWSCPSKTSGDYTRLAGFVPHGNGESRPCKTARHFCAISVQFLCRTVRRTCAWRPYFHRRWGRAGDHEQVLHDALWQQADGSRSAVR